MKNIAVFYGGKSTEHDISIITAIQVMNNLDKKYKIVPIYCYLDGFFTSNVALDISQYVDFDIKKWQKVIFDNGKMRYLTLKKPVKIDCAVLCTHGGSGENGGLQGYLDMVNIPYTSSKVLSSSICMDKVMSKMYFKAIGLDIVDFVEVTKADYTANKEQVLSNVVSMLDFPVITKPNDLGSSIGIKIADNIEELDESLLVAFDYSDTIIVEKALVDFTEYNCAGLNTNIGLFVSDIEKPVGWQDYLTFEYKYLGNISKVKSEFPANIDKKLEENIKNITAKVIKNLKIDGVIRCDFMYSNNSNTLYINEINTIPGSLAYYLFSKQFSFSKLLNIMIDDAIFKHTNRQKNIFTYKTNVLENFKSGTCGKLKIK